MVVVGTNHFAGAQRADQHGHRAHATKGPVSTESALWSFDVVQHEEAGEPGR